MSARRGLTLLGALLLGCVAPAPSPGPSLERDPQSPVFRAWNAGVDGGFGWTAADPYVLFDDSEGLYKAWWSSLFVERCDGALFDPEQSAVHVMYAESTDGLSWSLQPEPALASHAASGDWDYSTVETPTVIQVPDAPEDRRFALLYAGSNSQEGPDGGPLLPRVAGQFAPWQVGLAFSADGRHFTRLPDAESPYAGVPLPFTQRTGLVLYVRDAFPGFPAAVYGSVADPEIVRVGSTYHLFFSAVGTDAAGSVVAANGAGIPPYGIGHATSPDLVHWTAAPENPVLPGGGQPAARSLEGGSVELWFSQDSPADLTGIPSQVFPTRGFFRATSPDGNHWAVPAQRSFVWDAGVDAEDLGLLNGAALLEHDGELRLYYGAWTDHDVPIGSCALVGGQLVPGNQVLDLAHAALP